MDIKYIVRIEYYDFWFESNLPLYSPFSDDLNITSIELASYLMNMLLFIWGITSFAVFGSPVLVSPVGAWS